MPLRALTLTLTPHIPVVGHFSTASLARALAAQVLALGRLLPDSVWPRAARLCETRMMRSMDFNAFQGSACIGASCFSPRNLAAQGVDWRSMLGAWRTEPMAGRCQNHV